MSAPIIFLDFDGVICSPRAHVAQRDRWTDPANGYRWADPVACDLVQILCKDHGALIVVSSTWRDMEARCRSVLDRYKLSPFLHDVWRTGHDKARFRGNEVEAWLAANGRPSFIILDDDGDFLPGQMPQLVQTDSVDGMMFKDWQRADALLKAAGAAKADEAEPVVIHRQSAGQTAEALAGWPVQREGC